MQMNMFSGVKLFARAAAALVVAASLVMPTAYAAGEKASASAVAVDKQAGQAQQKKSGLELVVKSFQEIEVTNKQGKKEKKTVPVGKIVPGDEVIYVITWKNHGAQPADGVVINNVVPKEVGFVAGSAKAAGAVDEVSVDGGQTWGDLAMLTIKEEDGSTRAAAGADVTAVHWTLTAPVKPGAVGSVGYRAIVK